MNTRRYDKEGNILLIGESQRKDGRYMYRWTVEGKEKTVYALDLSELREKERQICPSLNRRITVFDDITSEFTDILYVVANDYRHKMDCALEDELSSYKEFMLFFEKELPEIYKRLMKEFRRRKYDE